MKASLLLLGLAAAAQAAVPLCSAICVTNAIAATGCSASDTACVCSSDKYFASVAECAETDCSGDEAVMETAQGFCERAGLKTEVKRWGPPHGFEGKFKGFRGGRGRWRRPGKGRKHHKGGKSKGGEKSGETTTGKTTTGGSTDTGSHKGGPPSWWRGGHQGGSHGGSKGGEHGGSHGGSKGGESGGSKGGSGSGSSDHGSGSGHHWSGKPKPGGWSDWGHHTTPSGPVNTVI